MVNLEASHHSAPEPARRTPRTLYLALLKDQPLPTSLIQAVRTGREESQEDKSPEESEDTSGNLLSASEIDPVHVVMLCNKLQEAREIGHSLQMKIQGEKRTHRLEVPANGDLTAYAERALAIAEGELEGIEIRVEEFSLREVFRDDLIDVFHGSISSFPKLQELLLARCGEVSQDSLGAWIDLMPTYEEFALLEDNAQRNIVAVLEEVLEMNDFVEASFMAGSYLLSLPGYDPDPSREISQSLWSAKTSTSIFTTLTGIAPHSINNGEELLRAVVNPETKCANCQALLLYIEAVRRFGDRTKTARVISEFLDSEIPELKDSTLAHLGEEAVLTLEKLLNGH